MEHIVVYETLPLLRDQIIDFLSKLSFIDFKTIGHCGLEDTEKNLLNYNWAWFDSALVRPNALKHFKKKYSHLKTIIFGMNDSISDVHDYYKSGADGYLCKCASAPTIEKMMQCIAQGKKYLSDELTQSISNWSDPKTKIKNQLTSRERETLSLIVDGFSTKEIAEKLFVEPCTIETHRLNLLQKLEAKNTASLVCKAMQHRLWGDWKF